MTDIQRLEPATPRPLMPGPSRPGRATLQWQTRPTCPTRTTKVWIMTRKSDKKTTSWASLFRHRRRRRPRHPPYSIRVCLLVKNSCRRQTCNLPHPVLGPPDPGCAPPVRRNPSSRIGQPARTSSRSRCAQPTSRRPPGTLFSHPRPGSAASLNGRLVRELPLTITTSRRPPPLDPLDDRSLLSICPPRLQRSSNPGKTA